MSSLGVFPISPVRRQYPAHRREEPRAAGLTALPIDSPESKELLRKAKGLKDTIGAPQKILAFSDTFNRAFGAVEMAENAYQPGEYVGPPKFWGSFDQVVRKGAGALGILGGGFQAGLGAVQFAKGEKADGTVNVGVGSLYIVAGATELSRRFAASVGALFTRVGARMGGGLVPVAAPLTGLANFIGGAYQFFKGRRTGDERAVGIGGLKAVGGAMLVSSAFLGGTVAGIPLAVGASVVGSVLCLAGVFWENFPGIKRFWHNVGSKLGLTKTPPPDETDA